MTNNFRQMKEQSESRKKWNKTKEKWTRHFVAFFCTILAFTPLWFFLFIKSILAPEGFWQKFVVYGLGIYLLGLIQLVLLVILVGVLIHVVYDV